jgi:hypothetical protein
MFRRPMEPYKDEAMARLRRINPVLLATLVGAEESPAAIRGLQLILNSIGRRPR